ncbi:MAG: acyl-CoA dehydrogenase [Candidatus Lokiarchaeota archaeon]|nr:acyl-CoA dehydrogenase [Candidatus Lokiarchaeota archaeon]
MDTRLPEFPKMEISNYITQLDLLNNPIFTTKEKKFLTGFYEYMEENLEKDLKILEELNYMAEEPIQEKKKEIVANFMKKLAEKGYYSTVIDFEEHEVGNVTRNALIALVLCGGFWSQNSDRYINGNWSIEMGRLAGGTLYCNPVNYKANEFQREKYLIPVVKFGLMAASAMTEFNAGSDIARIELKLDEKGDKVIANGKKLFITNGMLAENIILYGRLNSGRLGGIIVDTEHQQLKNFESSRVRTYGMNDAFVSRLVFNDVELLKENLLEGDGLDIMFHQLTEERLVISAEAIGDCIKKLFFSHSFALQREQFKHKLHQYQIIRFPIAENIRQTNLFLSALINYTREIDKHPQAASSKMMASQSMGLKIQTSELAFQSSIDLFRTMGGRAFTEQYCNQVGLLDAYCMIHGGGSHYVLGDAESRRFFKTK